MGVKGFQKGHLVSDETRAKISKANNGNFFAICDYCGKEYIERNELIKNLKYFAPEHYSGLIDNLIMKQPAADVEPVRHGYWTEIVIPGEVFDYDCVCSLCGKSGLPIYNFCPNCGAKMDGGDDGETD